ncbi:MAG TPA: extracellular solute-binding protein [Nitrososphaeraceae archaeon]|nr:extracellular solute-binding protein [Nitrososphaeraceae archaeon]
MKTRAGVSRIIVTGRRWQQLFKTSYYCIAKMNLVVITALLMIIIITTTPTILQPTLGTANLSSNNTTSTQYNSSFTLVPSNQSITGTSSTSDKTNVTLRGLFDHLGEPGSWNQLLQPALEELNRRHPDMNIQIEYDGFPYSETRNQIIDRISNGESVDIISVDQIWLGEFAERGLLTNLTDEFEEWGRSSDLYEANLDGCVYNNTIYGLWLWTDIRGMWYWKDMLQEAGVDPESLKTWDGYISAAVRLNDFFGDRVTQGVHILGTSYDLDMWYPYLWMLGGEILEMREGHPTKGVYWFPSYNSSEGVKAMNFLKRQVVDAGIEPQKEHYWGAEFANRTFAVMLEGSWMPLFFPKESWPTLEQEVGFIPMFPVPNQTIPTSTMMGGWEVAIPSTSQNSDLSWELITIMAQPEILGPFLQQNVYLPTQRVLGDGPSSQPLKESVPFFEEMVSLIPHARSRPSIPEYPEIAEHITQAIQQVYNGSAASPEDALNTAAAKSADYLGWKVIQ